MARKEIKPVKQFKIVLNKDKWVIRLYTKADFERKWKNCIAITEYEHKTPDLSINFSGPRVSRDTIAHELFHAYLAYKDYSKLTSHTIEERFCEMIGKRYKVLYTLTEMVYVKLSDGRLTLKQGDSKWHLNLGWHLIVKQLTRWGRWIKIRGKRILQRLKAII